VGGNYKSVLTHDGSRADVINTAVQFDTDPVGDIVAGFDFACSSFCSGETKCVGRSTDGELGDGLDTESTTLVIAAGPDSVCSIIK
jgi:hypothetical protein